MIGTLIKAAAYVVAPRATFTLRHPVRRVRVAKAGYDLRHAYAPRLTALVAAVVVAPLAYRLGKRAGRAEFRLPPGREYL